jgi:photosystem II stability/assembly factor-like uncharacterized protein
MNNKLTILIAIGLISINLVSAQYQWVSQTSGNSGFLTSVYFVSADTGYVCSQAGSILKTVNGGTNWNSVGTGPYSGLCFRNAQIGFGGNDTELLYTQNGGVTWTTCYSNPNVWGIGNICFPGKKQGYAMGWSYNTGGYILKTLNSGVTWDTLYNYPLGIISIMTMFFKDSLHGYVGLDNGRIIKTANGGLSWSTVAVDTINQPMISSIYFSSANIGYAASDVRGVFKTTDGGNTWNHLSFTFSPALYSIWFIDDNRGFVAGGDGMTSMVLYQTSNGGSTWTQSASGINTLTTLFFIDSIPGYAVGDNGTILKYVHVTGLEQDNLIKNINIYPNPVTTTISIEGVIENTIAEIFDISGKLLLSKQLNENQLDISTLAKGLYFIKLSTAEGSVVWKFIKE